jgi:Holliday junction resolvase
MKDYPKLKDRKKLEKEITKEIREYLKYRGIFHYKNWQGLGSAKGVSDIIGIYKGRFLAIEVKTERGQLSDHQEIFLNTINHEGGIGFVARNVYPDVVIGLTVTDEFLYKAPQDRKWCKGCGLLNDKKTT